MKIKNKIFGIVALSGIAILAVFYFSKLGGWTKFSPEGLPLKTEKEAGMNLPEDRLAVLAIDYGDRPSEEFSGEARNGDTVLVFMGRLLALKNIAFIYKDFPGLGSLVDQIGEKKNGDGGKYWQYWVNGDYAKVGADAYGINPGDSILWKFANQQDF